METNKKTLKEKIKNRETTIGTLVSIPDVTSGIITGRAGYDFIWIDLEHSPIDFQTLVALVVAVKAGGTDVIVRVPQNDLTYTKKVLEIGVDGIIFPMIRNAAEANENISNTLYPPYGTRGFGPQNAIGYGYDDAWEYVANSKDRLCRFIQIEHIGAVENIDEIMKNEYIDGYIFGPNDLSGSIGEIGRVFDKNTTELIELCVEKLRAAGKYVGLATGDISEKTLRHWHSKGIDMITAGADYDFIRMLAVQNCENLKKIYKKGE